MENVVVNVVVVVSGAEMSAQMWSENGLGKGTSPAPTSSSLAKMAWSTEELCENVLRIPRVKPKRIRSATGRTGREIGTATRTLGTHLAFQTFFPVLIENRSLVRVT